MIKKFSKLLTSTAILLSLATAGITSNAMAFSLFAKDNDLLIRGMIESEISPKMDSEIETIKSEAANFALNYNATSTIRSFMPLTSSGGISVKLLSGALFNFGKTGSSFSAAIGGNGIINNNEASLYVMKFGQPDANENMPVELAGKYIIILFDHDPINNVNMHVPTNFPPSKTKCLTNSTEVIRAAYEGDASILKTSGLISSNVLKNTIVSKTSPYLANCVYADITSPISDEIFKTSVPSAFTVITNPSQYAVSIKPAKTN